jgi:hypothetical protein
MSKRKLVFIAIPTKGTVTDGALNESFLRAFAALQMRFPDITFWAPMVQDYQLLRFMPSTAATWEEWGQHCRVMIERSDEVWVLQFDGWETSVGVKGEVYHAGLHDVTVKYFNPEII